LAARVKDGSFREDLFYRLNVVEIDLPPLRERAEDIPLLASHFLKRYAERIDKNVSKITSEVERAFRLYGWPGNVRELENAMERAVILCRGDAVTMADLPPAVKGSTPTGMGGTGSLDEQVAQSERFYIGRALEAEDGDPQRAARSLAISPSTLYRKMKKHGIPLPKDR
jgi:DNA-binding NtrC family response regulator